METQDNSASHQLVSKSDVAAMWRMSKRSVDRVVAKKQLKPIHILGAVRYRLSDVKAISEGGAS